MLLGYKTTNSKNNNPIIEISSLVLHMWETIQMPVLHRY